jgi:hypothetical protein
MWPAQDDGLVAVFTAAAIMSVIAAIASLVRGKKHLHMEDSVAKAKLSSESRV